ERKEGGPVPELETLIKLLTEAAIAHSAEVGSETEAGDLEVLLTGCLQIMTDEQRGALFQLPSVRELLEVPEYAQVAAMVAPADPVELSKDEVLDLLREAGPLRTIYLWVVGNGYLK